MQPACLASLTRSTGSMPLYGHVAGTAVEGGFNSQKSRPTYFAHLALVNLQYVSLSLRVSGDCVELLCFKWLG